MNKWEEEYKRVMPKIDGMIEKQNKKIGELTGDRSATNKEEFAKQEKQLQKAKKEKERLEKIKANKRKIENVLKYREEVEEKRNKIEAELKFRKEATEIPKKIAHLQEKHEEILKKRKNPNLSQEEINRLSEEDRKNNEEMGNQQDKVKELLENNKNRELADLSMEELETSKTEIATTISKCNLVCEGLFNGLDWDAIGKKIEDFEQKVFKSKDGKLKEEKEKLKKAREEEKEKFEFDETELDLDNDDFEIIGDNLPTPTFEEKHPRLAKIKKWFKNIFTRENKQDVQELEEKDEKRQDNKKEDISFKDYIKQIAERGTEEEKAAKAARKQELLEKVGKDREANKKAAYDREVTNFGEDYAKKSYKGPER